MAAPLPRGLSAVDPLVAAFRKQRETIKRLLDEAGVPLADADEVLMEAFRAIPLRVEGYNVEAELLECIDAACCGYAARQGRPYRGLHENREE